MEIKDIRLLASNFRLEFDKPTPEQGRVKTSANYEAGYNEKENEITVLFTITCVDNEAPFWFEVKFGGKFILSSDEASSLERICRVNCPSILFPYLREHIADLTRRAGIPPFHLDSVNFVEIARQQAQASLASANSQ